MPTVLRNVVERHLAHPVAMYNTGWEDSLIALGLALVARDFDHEQSAHWFRQWLSYHLGGGIHHLSGSADVPLRVGDRQVGIFLGSYSGDWGIPSHIAALGNSTTETDLAALDEVAEHIMAAPVRGDAGIILHSATQRQPWVDSLYYSAAPLALAAATRNRPDWALESVRQCLLHSAALRDSTTGCFFHELDPASGTRPAWLWSRGNGWVAMAFADVLAHVPVDTPGYAELLSDFRDLITGLLRLQHPSGLWRIVPENEESHLETSGSIMIATGIAVGIRHGMLDATTAAYVRKTWNEIETWVDDDGVLHGCQTPAGVGGWETHKRSGMGERTYGTGAFLRFAAEARAAKII